MQKTSAAVTKNSQIQSALAWAVGVALFLASVKLVTGLWTHSMAVLASSLDSWMDMAMSFVNLLAAREASKPPDAEHTYGHGKIESLASLFQAIFVGSSGFYVVWESVRRLIYGTFIKEISAGIFIMLASMAVTAILVWRLKSTGKRNKSLILSTEALHYTMDFLANAGILVALILVQLTGAVWWDLLFSFGVAVYILKTALMILRKSIDELLDSSLPPRSHQEIAEVVLGFHPSIVGLHNLRSRHVGSQVFLDLHVEIRGEQDFKKAHDMTEALIKQIQNRFPGADITIHYDPEGAE